MQRAFQRYSFSITCNRPLAEKVNQWVFIGGIGYNGTALSSGTDFASPFSITIPAGNTSAKINLSSIDDVVYEGNETIVAEITSVAGVEITANADQKATITIIDDESEPTVSLSASPVKISENLAVSEITATLSVESTMPVTVVLFYSGTAIGSGTDYTAASTTIEIPAGSLTGIATVTSVDDPIYEGNEIIKAEIVAVTNATENGNQQTIITIEDDETLPKVTLSAISLSILENGDVSTLTATLSGITTQPVTVFIGFTGTASASDYTIGSPTIMIPAGSISGTTTVTSVNDAVYEISETIIVDITGVTNATENNLQKSTINILDDETAPTVLLSANPTSVIENGGIVISALTATLSNATYQPVSITIGYSGNAVLGTDYSSPSTIVILAGSLTGSINLTAINDANYEGSETVTADIVTVLGGGATENENQTASITINDDELAPTVTLSASPASIVENGGVSMLTASLSSATYENVSVTISYSGTASNGTDFAASTIISIAVGQTSGTINISSVDDLHFEGNETFSAEITSVSGGNATENGIQKQTITITDNEAAPTVSLSVSDTQMGETGGSSDVMAILSATTYQDVVVRLGYSGTAENGTDYVGSDITIYAGQLSGTININTADDYIYEGTETVVVDIINVIGGNATEDSQQQQTISIIDDEENPVVTLAANPESIGENGMISTITASLSCITFEDVVVTLTYTGTAKNLDVDYSAPTTITIQKGNLTGTINVTSTYDLIYEANETVIADITNVLGGGASENQFADEQATINIIEEGIAPIITLAANDAVASESGSNNGQVKVSMTNASSTATVVNLSILGTAVNGTDYSTILEKVTIPEGATAAYINIVIADDAEVETSETVVFKITSIDSGNDKITLGSTLGGIVTISDNDASTITISATDNAASETATDNGQFTVSMTNASSTDTKLNISLSGTATNGTDYIEIPATITLPVGLTSATFNVLVIDDELLEADETVIAKITSIASGDDQIVLGSTLVGTVTIADDDASIISLTANDAAADESGTNNGQFTVNITKASSTPTIINLNVSGTATNGTDYVNIPTTVTITADLKTVNIDVSIIGDVLVEANETVMVTIVSIASGNPQITLGTILSGTVTISDDDVASITIAANEAVADESGSNNGQFMVSMSNASSTETVISVTISGTGTNGTDYNAIPVSLTIPANTKTAFINVDVKSDLLVEANETVIATINSITSGDPQIDLGLVLNGTVTISDDDVASVYIFANDETASETAGNNGQYTVSITNVSSTETVINLAITGASINGTDYTEIPATVTIPAGSASATINLLATDDIILEADETVDLKIESIESGDDQISLGTELTATAIITDNDASIITIVANDPGADESGANPGQFTVSMTNASSTETIIDLILSGTASSATDYTEIPLLVTIPAGSTSTTIDVVVAGDDLVEANETVIATISSIAFGNPQITLGTTLVGKVTITDDDVATLSIAANDASADESGSNNGQFTVTMTNASSTETVVNLAITGTGTNGTDYSNIPATVSIPAGSTSAIVDVAVIDDVLVEANETVLITLSSIALSDPQITLGSILSGTITIIDNDYATISLSADDVDAGEAASNNGHYTVNMTNASSTATVINLVISGTAINGTDYTNIPTTVTIPAGSTTATIDVLVTDDALLEDDENVKVELTSISSGDPEITLGTLLSGIVNITDNDNATVSITANDADACETPTNSGQFTVSITNASSTETIIPLTITGTATNGTDYANVLSTVSIPAGSISAFIQVVVTDDNILEADETVIVTINPIVTGDPQISLSTELEGTVTIIDNDASKITISANDAVADESGTNNGQFTVSMTKTSSTETLINYTITGTATNGTDFANIPSNVTIPAGSTSSVIDVAVINDNLVEANETVMCTITSVASGDPQITLGTTLSGTITIDDDDVAKVTIAANKSAADESGTNNGQFTISMTNASSTATVINFAVTGTGTNGTDYSTIQSSVNMPAGSTEATIDVSVNTDALVEANETVIINLSLVFSGDPQITLGDELTAMVTITDDDFATVSISANDDAASETTGNNGQFTVSMTKASSTETLINLTISGTAINGTDYTNIPATVAIPAGSTTSTINILATDDALLETDENITITMASIASSDPQIALDLPVMVEVVISDNDLASITITANDAAAGESGTNPGQFTVSMTNASSTETVVNFTITGNATNGTDFANITPTVTIPAGSTSAIIDVTVLGDALVEANETVMATIASIALGDPQITLGSTLIGTVTITDDDVATVSITANDACADESGSNNGQFTVAMTNASSTETLINLAITGTGTNGTDYDNIPTTVSIPAGSTSAIINVTVNGDVLVEADETVIATITSIALSDPQITLSSTLTGTVTITDDDNATVTIAANVPDADESGTNNGQFTVSMTNPSSTATVINFTLNGSATNGTDYTDIPTVVTIPAGSTTANINVNVIGDNLVEADETVISTLTLIASGDPQVTLGVDKLGTVTISDDDVAIVTITAIDDAADETGANNGKLLVALTNPSSSSTVINLNIEGTATNGVDYNTIPVAVTIPAGSKTASINVNTIGDVLVEGTETVLVTLVSITLGDPQISIGIPLAGTVNILDNNVAGFTLSKATLNTNEFGITDNFNIVLTAQPNSNVVVNFESGNIAEGTLNVTQVVFTPANWNVPQNVIVTGVDDLLADGNITFNMTASVAKDFSDDHFDLFPDKTISVTNADNDSPGVTVSAISKNTSESGIQSTFTIVLNTQPSADVNISLNSNDVTEGTIVVSNLNFNSVNWKTPQTITVTGVNDVLVDGNIAYQIVTGNTSSTDLNYNNIVVADVEVVNDDNDFAGFALNKTVANTNESGTTNNFSIVLIAQPTSDVIIDLVSGDLTEGTIGITQTTFTSSNWNVPQQVTITGVDDLVADGNITYLVTASINIGGSDPNFGSLFAQTVSVTNADNDTPGISISAVSNHTHEDGTQANFAVVLNTQPTADVAVSLTSIDLTEGTINASNLIFTQANWNVAQSVTITGVNDQLIDGDITFNIVTGDALSADGNYNNMVVDDATVVNDDNDVAGFAINRTSANTNEFGTTDNFDIVLNIQPNTNVVFNLASSDLTEGTIGTSQVTFAPENWNTPQNVIITGVDDLLLDGNIDFDVIVSVNSACSDAKFGALAAQMVVVTNSDNDSPGVTVTAISKHTTEDGTQATFGIVLNAAPSADVTISLNSNDETEGTISASLATFTSANWNSVQSFTVTGMNDAWIDGDITFNIVTGDASSLDDNYNNMVVNDIEVINNDNDAAGYILNKVVAYTNESGTTDNFSIVLKAEPTSNVSINLVSADLTEGTLDVSQITFTPSNWNVAQTVTITGVNDNLIDQNITYQIVASLNTQSSDPNFVSLPAQFVAVTNVDNDASQPFAQNDEIILDENTSATCAVLINDSGLEDGGLSVSIVTQPLNGKAVVNIDNTVTYTPANLYNGFDSFTYKVCDAFGDCSSAMVSVTVNPVNNPPIAEPDFYTVKMNTSNSLFNVSDNDSDTDNDLVAGSVVILQAPSSGSEASVNGLGDINYKPLQNFFGTDTIPYRIFDATGLSDIDTLFVTVEFEMSIVNTFSPNGDGLNDEFIIPNIEDYENEVFIYNRWGSEIFHTQNYRNDNAWDGRAQKKSNMGDNQVLPVGTYFYIVNIKGSDKPLKGYIYLKY